MSNAGFRRLRYAMQNRSGTAAAKWNGPEEKKRLPQEKLDSLVDDSKKYGDLTRNRSDLHADDVAYIRSKLKESYRPKFSEFAAASKKKTPDTVQTHHKVGDRVYCTQPDNVSIKGGVVKRLGRTMIHVKHDGSDEVSAYRPEHVQSQSYPNN